ncbi:MAG: HK97 family phage prohead protease [Candidatus Komeilibacteria bacterium]|nr:HK97 family phage prohead protease [Candidatus Komeilibacteria bacterium]
MRKFYQLSTKSFSELKVKTYKDLWDKIQEKGFEGFTLPVFTIFQKAEGVDNLFHAIFSTAAEDRHGDVVEQNWDLKSYKNNPVLLDSHNYDSIEHIIGGIKNIKVKDDKLQGDVYFALESPKGMLAYKLRLAGLLNTLSVGFIPKEFSDDGMSIVKSELLEISAVPVPANPEALFEKNYDKSKGNEDPENPEGDEPPAPGNGDGGEAGGKNNNDAGEQNGGEQNNGQPGDQQPTNQGGENSPTGTAEPVKSNPLKTINSAANLIIEKRCGALARINKAIDVIGAVTVTGEDPATATKIATNRTINQAIRKLLKLKV